MPMSKQRDSRGYENCAEYNVFNPPELSLSEGRYPDLLETFK